ncbi:homeobox-domain-containing protein [Leucogyrophana mollusca]|uniref:Homeobox-domain-containing protein n=1 Tax=Leucogyrophana mollusca TaxID=85980 RepID=A0ACB8BKA9_9AGAM|nr:homeobox-domain-containing protein [Leucogyrophana mollusca]
MSNPSTPTANISPKSLTATPKLQTASRRIEHENIHPLAQDDHQQQRPASSRTTSFGQSNPTPHQRKHDTTGEGSSLHSRPEEDVSGRRPKKRIRRTRSVNMMGERPSSSSDSSSQSGMADNETEAERSQQSELSAPATAPPKKKRTRTLTTPHQSSVLHALLAQSRFPTTAMREEVGRQIGLSARKVQIWFQNQRQKARRPQGETTAPLTRPPQFGPFPSAPTSVPPTTSSFLAAHPDDPTLTDQSPDAGPSGSRASGALDLDPGLSGPGMPGWRSGSHHRPGSAEDWESSTREPADHEPASVMPQYRTSYGAEETRGLREAALPSMRSLVPRPHHLQDDDQPPEPGFSRILPPLNFSASDSRSTDPYVSPTSYLPSHSRNPNANSMLPFSSTSHRTFDLAGSGRAAIPPPFALQPPPQWDPQSFTPYTRPEFASWSDRPGRSQSARGSFSAVGAHDRSTPNISRGSHYFPSTEQRIPSSRPRPFDPLHDIITSSGGQTAPDFPSLSPPRGGGHEESDDEVQDHH